MKRDRKLSVFDHVLAKIAYEVIGDGFPVIHLHGYELDRNSLKNQLENYYTQYPGIQRIYFDLPGMGDSHAKPLLTNISRMCEVLKVFINQIIPQKPLAFVGLSYGAYLGRCLTHQLNGRVKQNLWICPVIKPEFTDRILPDFQVHSSDLQFIKTLSSEEYEGIKDWLVVQNREVYTHYQKEIIAGLRKGQKRFLAEYQKNGYGYPETVDRDFAPIKTKTTFVCGKNDIVVGYRDAVSILEHYLNADIHIFSGAGHYLQREQERKFEFLFRQWISELPLV